MSLTLHQILQGVADYERVTVEQLASRDYGRLACRARSRALWLARQLTRCSSTRIGQVFGGRDHGTVLRVVARFQERLATDPSEREQLQSLMRHLDARQGGRA